MSAQEKSKKRKRVQFSVSEALEQQSGDGSGDDDDHDRENGVNTEIRNAVYNYLKQFDDTSLKPSFKDVRRTCTRELHFPKSFLKERKELLREMVADYYNEKEREPTPIETLKAKIKLKHFTNTENRIIKQCLESYSKEFSIDYSEINIETMTTTKKKRKNKILWDRLCAVLPNRNRKVRFSVFAV